MTAIDEQFEFDAPARGGALRGRLRKRVLGFVAVCFALAGALVWDDILPDGDRFGWDAFAPLDGQLTDIVPVRSGEAGVCAPVVELAPMAAALNRLSVVSPCTAGARVEIDHGGLRLAVALDEAGAAAVELPVLSAAARFDVVVPGAAPMTLRGVTFDREAYARTVLAMPRDAGLSLNAYEAGAGWGEPGHVGPQMPYGRDRALAGEGGYLTEIESAAAETALVYTAPVGLPVEIGVDAIVTEANCDREVSARVLRAEPGLPVQIVPLTVAMPGCDALGRVVMLRPFSGA